MGDAVERIYNEYRDCPVAGTYMFANPLLHLHDPEVIKQVLIKEFQVSPAAVLAAPGQTAEQTSRLPDARFVLIGGEPITIILPRGLFHDARVSVPQDFNGRGVSAIHPGADPLAAHLFFLSGPA